MNLKKAGALIEAFVLLFAVALALPHTALADSSQPDEKIVAPPSSKDGLTPLSDFATMQSDWLYIEGSPLRIGAARDSQMSVSLDGVRQYYSETAKGSFLNLNGTQLQFDFGNAPAWSGNQASLDFTPVSHSKPDDWTIVTVFDAGETGVRVTQTITYVNGSRYYRLSWVIENSGAVSYENCSFLHGGDTYFGGDDSAIGHWDDSLGMVYLTNPNPAIDGIMGLYGAPVSPADRYFEGRYSTNWSHMAAGNLPNTVDADYHDAAYSLQWNRQTLGPNQSWSITAFEKWTTAGFVQVIAPAERTAISGESVQHVFGISNMGQDAEEYTLSVTSSEGWAVSAPDSVTVPAGQTRNVTVQLAVPFGALSGTADTVALTATSVSDPDIFNTDAVTTLVVGAEIRSPVRSGTILEGDTLRFSAQGPPGDYVWDFGDGRTSQQMVPGLVTFPTAGNFAVVLNRMDPSTQTRVPQDERAINVAPDEGPIPDLAATFMDVDDALAIGQPTDIAYTVRNIGDADLTGSAWIDAMYLSRIPHLDTRAIRLASVPVSRDVAAGGQYQGSITVTLPAAVEEGAYYLILVVDDTWQILERRRLNNERAVATAVAVPVLDPGAEQTVPYPQGQVSQYFQFEAPGEGQEARLTFSGLPAGMDVYVRHGALPTRAAYDFRLRGGQLSIPAATQGAWYILVVGEGIPAPGEYTVGFTTAALRLASVSPSLHAANAPLDMALTGSGFRAPIAVDLLDGDGTAYPADSVEVDSHSRLSASFAAGALPAGVYSARVSRDGMSDTIAGAIEIVTDGEAQLEINLILPARFGYHMVATVYVEYANTGEVSMPAPLLQVTATQNGRQAAILTLDETRVSQGLWSSVVPEGFANSVQFLASGDMPGLLQPGESRRVPVYYVGWQRPWDFSYPPFNWNVGVLAADNDTPADWASLKAGMRPSYIREDAWDVVWDNYTAQAGSTWGDYVAMLSRIAVHLDRQGQRVQDIERLLAFAFRQAEGVSPLPALAVVTDAVVQAPGMPIALRRMYAHPISRRFEMGPLGRGWTHNWQQRLVARDDGSIVVTGVSGTPRSFHPDERPGRPYLASPGDHGVLRQDGDGYLLTEANGFKRRFDDQGRLDYVEDTNGNRITCDYAGGQLASLTHSSGQSLAFAYNGTGSIASATDHHGRQTLYDYDGEHLAQVQAHDGRTTAYDYNTAPGDAARNALAEIVFPDGTRRAFSYDARGRLAAIARGGDAERISFAYESLGRVTAADALGNATRFFFDYAGRIVRTEDPLGSAVQYAFDELGQLVSVTDPAGAASTFEYDRRGNLALATDALRQTTAFTHTPTLNRLASVTDARGNRTYYDYDPSANLTAIRYPDGSQETWSYDGVGNPTDWTNRRNTPVGYEFDAAGRLTRKTYDGGGQVDYSYDARGNLVQTVDATGATLFAYDERDYLTRIDYPGDRWLQFAYDGAGRRTSSEDQEGRRLNYYFEDDAGRLERIEDEDGAEIVRYEYDAVGRLAQMILGNGVQTEYDYDSVGQLLSLVNRAPDATVVSRFDYTYDRRGRRTGMATHYGTWTYQYDDIGQLTRAVLDSTEAGIPDQDILYEYDALGNRVRATVNGTQEEYDPNALNQYAEVGGRTYTYDPDGNLIEESGPGGVTVYTYDDENRLVGVLRGGDEWAYTYDALGNRVAVSENGAITHYVVDPVGHGNVVAQYDDAGNLLARFDHGHALLNRVDDQGEAAYYTFDAIGSASELVGAGGAVLNAYAYRPFGDSLRHEASVPNPFGYVGQWGVMADGNGLNFARARYYQPEVGRFVSPDPLGIAGGINLYAFALNSPTMLTDITGLCAARTAGQVISGVDTAMSYGVWGPRIGVALGGLLTLTKFGAPIGIPMMTKSLAVMPYTEAYDQLAPPGAPHPVGLIGQDLQRYCAPSEDPVKPPDVPSDSFTDGDSGSAGSVDPNEKTGPAGHGPSNYVADGQALVYRVDFENLESATAPAQVVTVSDPLSEDFDWSSFELMEIGFGDLLIVVPEGHRQRFDTVVPYSYGGVDFEVEIEAGIRLATGEVFANFYTTDPETGLPPPVDIGFLPPEDGTGRGQGHFSYILNADPGLPSGTEIRNIARIQFDFGLIIYTNQVDPLDPDAGTDPDLEAPVAFDTIPPVSRVHDLPATTETLAFQVAWSGEDDEHGSGIRGFDIFVREDSGPWELWRANAQGGSAQFDGENGRSYAFYSIAVDNVGHREQKAPQAEAFTNVRVDDEGEPLPTARLVVPSPDRIVVPPDTLVAIEVIPGTDGLDPASVMIRLDGTLVYDGGNLTGDREYEAPGHGICRRADRGGIHRFTFLKDDPFAFDQEVEVEVDATDAQGDPMDTARFGFRVMPRPFGGLRRVNDVPRGVAGRPALAADAEGNLFAVWEQNGRIRGSALNADERQWTESVLVFDTGNPQSAPAIAAFRDDEEIVHVVFTDRREGQDAVYLAVFIDGEFDDGLSNYLSPQESQAKAPSVAYAEGAGRLYFAWQEREAEEDTWGIVVLEVNVADDEETLHRIQVAAADQTQPALAVWGPDAYVVWTHTRGDGTTDLLGASSVNGWATVDVLVDPASSQKRPALAIGAGPVFHVVWEDDRGDAPGVYYATGNALTLDPADAMNVESDADAQAATQSRPSAQAVGDRVFVAWQDDRHADVGAPDDMDIFFAEKDLGDPAFGQSLLVHPSAAAQEDPVMALRQGHPFVLWRESGNLFGKGATHSRPVGAGVLPVVPGVPGGAPTVLEVGDLGPGSPGVRVPPNAVDIPVDIVVRRVLNPPPPPPRGIGVPWDFGPSGLEFLEPVTLEIPVTPEDMAGHTPPYRVFWYDEARAAVGDPWRRDGISNVVYHRAAGVIRFTTTHFTIFSAASSSPDDTAPTRRSSSSSGCTMSGSGPGDPSLLWLPLALLALVVWRDSRRRRTEG